MRIYGLKRVQFNEDCKHFQVKCTFEICEDCGGRGSTTSHIEPDGVGFTSSEWAEACAGDPDFPEMYFNGDYDRDCEECDGRRVVPVPDWTNKPELEKLVEKASQSEADYRAEVAAERRALGCY